MRILVVPGSLREGSFNGAIARAAMALAVLVLFAIFFSYKEEKA